MVMVVRLVVIGTVIEVRRGQFVPLRNWFW